MKKIYFLVLALCLFTGVNAQIINIPDANFKAKLLASDVTNTIAQTYSETNFSYSNIKIDANNNGEIEINEALSVYKLDVSSSEIANLDGLSNFTNLKIFSANSNWNLTSLNLNGLTNVSELYLQTCRLAVIDVSMLSNLKILYCGNNETVSFLNLGNLNSLQILSCVNNGLTTLNLSGTPNLITLYCGDNDLTELNVSNLSNLVRLYCENNHIVSLNLDNLLYLKEFVCSSNSLTNLSLINLPKLEAFSCNYNQLTTLNANYSPLLYSFNCDNNQLISLFLKNGKNEWMSSSSFQYNNALEYICADESQIAAVQNKISTYGYTNCHVNSYCSFIPGGTYYTISGNNRIDTDNNGCDASDVAYSNLKFNITNGANTGIMISNANGGYSIPVAAGTHTLTPVFENPTYFTVSPSSANIAFPTQISPFIQNFCITANGVHPDLEISILPINAARPGFDATYKLVYKNKGNTTQSGTVNLVFNDAVLDLVSANPVVTTQTVNNLSWNFTSLAPFESREIAFTLNVNSPMETPAVNNGDVLNYTATVVSPATDDMPNDNTFTFNQTVVNSYDPNDKTCLEGATIPPSKIGDYVHYMIRFENNGTANAQNIVVKDMIDTNKFDISSLVPIKGSHNFFTRINGNKVEFIFENINLPFDDANNDGYISFKIRTKPTLVLGNTFSNSASIYFDYNFPIVTNTATTTIQALSRQDFEFSSYFKLYPNPVNTTLNIETKETIEITSINIYNALGQLVLVVPNAQNVKTVDVSILSSGNYFIKINSDKGTSNTKFIKQ